MIHDTFEDTDATPQQALDAGFHPKAVSIALAVTNPKIEDSDEQLRVLFQQILAEGVGAVIVKGCDRVTNMRNGTRTQNWRKFIKYVNQHPKFEGALWDVAHRPTALMWHEMRELVRIHGPTARKALAA